MNIRITLRKCIQNTRSDAKNTLINLSLLTLTFTSVVTVAVLLTNVGRLISRAREQFHLTIYLKEGAGKERIEGLMKAVKKLPEVRYVKYTPKETLYRNFLKVGGKSELKRIGAEVFPDTLQVDLTPRFLQQSTTSLLIDKIKKIDIVEDVGYRESYLRQIDGVLKVVWGVFLAFAALSLLSSFLVQSNMMLLSFSKRETAIEVMRLCGATNSFIEAPVLLEGLMVALVASLIAVAAVWGAVTVMDREIASYLHGILSFRIDFVPTAGTILIVAACSATGLLGAFAASRKVLRV